MTMIEIVPHYDPPRHRLKVGDVVMVTLEMQDKDTRKPFDWRFLAVVQYATPNRCSVIRFGAADSSPRQGRRAGRSVLKDEHLLGYMQDGLTLHYLSEDAWPDAVHAFRAQLYLDGRLNDED